MREMQKGTRPSAKAIRIHKFPMIDEALMRFMQDSIAVGIPVTRKALADKALAVARKYGVYHRYKKTRGYLDKFLAACDPNVIVPVITVTTPQPHEIRSLPAIVVPPQTQCLPGMKERLLQRLRSNSVIFLQQLVQLIHQRLELTGALSKDTLCIKAKINKLMHELTTSLDNVLVTLQNLSVKDGALVDIASDLMRHHLALTSILISEFYLSVYKSVSQGQTTV